LRRWGLNGEEGKRRVLYCEIYATTVILSIIVIIITIVIIIVPTRPSQGHFPSNPDRHIISHIESRIACIPHPRAHNPCIEQHHHFFLPFFFGCFEMVSYRCSSKS